MLAFVQIWTIFLRFFYVFYVPFGRFGAFLGIFGVFLGILEYIWPKLANVCLSSFFGMGIMFIFVFVSFWCHLDSFVNVNIRPNVNVDHNVNVNVCPNLAFWTNKRLSMFANEDTSNKLYQGLRYDKLTFSVADITQTI